MKNLFAAVTAPSAPAIPLHRAERPAKPVPVPAPAPTGRIFVRDLLLSARVGIYDREKQADQRLRVNLDMAVTLPGPGARDEIGEVVSYEDALNLVTAIVGEGHVNLLETLAERIAAALLEDARVLSVTLRLEKLDAFEACASVGVEIVRGR
ncbi:dihydroneopterin aldolase [Aerophototrophica crusticola]